jgi:hypothetical protein
MASLNSYALTTVADVKESLGITGSSQDNLIIRKINQATDMIEAFCGKNNNQHFASTSYAEEYDGTGTNQLILRNRPVISFTSLEQRSTTENINDFDTINTEDYFVDSGAGVVECIFTLSLSFNMYRATYTAGFITIPSDLAEACVMLASALVENASTGAAVKKKTQGPKSIEYYESVQGESLITQLGIDDMLARYTDIPILADK